MKNNVQMAAMLASIGLQMGPNGLANSKGVSKSISKEERARRKTKKKVAKAFGCLKEMVKYILVLVIICGCLPKTEFEEREERADALRDMQRDCDRLVEQLNNGLKNEILYDQNEQLICKLSNPKVRWDTNEFRGIDQVQAALTVLRIKKNENVIVAFAKCIEPLNDQSLTSAQSLDEHNKCVKKTRYSRGLWLFE